MTETRFSDAATLGGTRKTADGYLVAEAYAVRTGIQLYRGSEVGMIDRDVVRVYRPEDEVRDPESLKTFSHAPITLGHPQAVTADNWSDLAKGEVSTEATWDGKKIKLPLIVKDAAAIEAVESGSHRELSAGYTCQLDWTPGVTADGEEYDAVQRTIRVNHIALVPRGRAGAECRIGDAAQDWGAMPLTDNATKQEAHMADNTKTVVLGDSAVTVPVADAAHIEAFKQRAEKRLSDAETAHAEAIAGKDRKLAAKDAEIDALKAKVLTGDALDARVAARAKLISDAAKVAKVETAGLSDDAIRKAVVVAKLGDDFAEMSQAYHDGRFVELVKAADAEAGKDPMREALKDAAPKATTLDALYTERNAELESAWKMEGK